MPPLRERLDDLPLIVPRLIERICRERGVTAPVQADPALLPKLAEHSWPGNVRELRNYLEQYVILQVAPPFESEGGGMVGDEAALTEGLLGLQLRAAKTELVDRFERQYLAKLLTETGGNVSEVARRAGVDRKTVFRTMRRIGMRSSEGES
jgi:DNA-binding NtrC family response regulator